MDSIVKLGKIIFGRPDKLDKLSQINIKTLIITGEDDVYRPPVEGEKMAELMPNAKFICIKNAGHISSLEQPQEVNAELLSFFESY
ncbi:alpha/beta hydrolase [Francisella sp. 19X1-34]|uniref:alpha/beta fold hydrolase n=1 Tax=Francisella sp. 19X1-34 TaxID=3087177 RepID=UPI002E322C6A|nr:alpha/beta hydrolase [Francisella sp. 19X1-34]MED7788136.1 alpha/beta hydrolase [Francisella sp. 19X1-34]